MISPRILVLEDCSPQQSVLGIALQRLGIAGVLHAGNSLDAMALMRVQGGVDIVIYDVSHKHVDYLAFLRRASQFGKVRAVLLFGDLDPESYREVEQMASLSGLELLGALPRPLQSRPLQKILRRYSNRCLSIRCTSKLPIELPSEDDIQRGLALGEFITYFQPKRALASGAMAGVEALTRWQHPTKGLLLPKDFFAAVLAYDLIDEVFKRVLEQGLNLQAVLRRQGQQLNLAFNLQASQLMRNGLTRHIQQRLDYYGLSGSDLTFELAENGLLEMQESTHAGLRHLRMLGCGLAIDEFGGGFSSMKLLCLLPFTQIKLDRQYVENLPMPLSRTVIVTTQALAEALNMALVVEGVRNPDEHLAIVEMGCQFAQGFYYAPPMTAHALICWIKTFSRTMV